MPAAPDGRRNITQAWGWWKSNDLATLGKLEYEFSDHLSVFADVGGTRSDVSRYSEQTPTVINAAGDITVTPMNWKFRVRRSTADTGLRARFRTGEVQHALVVMGNLYHDEFGSISNAGKLIASNIYAPAVAIDTGQPGRRAEPVGRRQPCGAPAGRATTVRAGVMNAFDRHYWGGVASYGTISQSAPRTVQLSAALDF